MRMTHPTWILARSLCPRVTPLWRFCPELWTNSLAGLGPYPREAIHSLAHLDSLSDVPGIALFVSERTLYILQNPAPLAAILTYLLAPAIVKVGSRAARFCKI